MKKAHSASGLLDFATIPYTALFLRTRKARPTRPVANRAIVPGSGTVRSAEPALRLAVVENCIPWETSNVVSIIVPESLSPLLSVPLTFPFSV